MELSKRQFMALTGSAAAFVLVGGSTIKAIAATDAVEQALVDFANGAEIKEGRISLDAPEIAENGNTVPISVSVDSPMTDDDYCSDVMLLADGNPNPDVATFHFTAMSGSAEATTRIRLAKTQNIIAVAKMSDGTCFIDKREVKVTIGGCGG